MLSILIPVYNFDVRPLVLDLQEQSERAGIIYEIICLDDGSQEKYQVLNRELAYSEKIRYQELKQNTGRSKIRNRLAEIAQYPYLLFMDCDSQTENKNFIANYVKELNEEVVLFGGRSYSPEPPPEKDQYFRWYYGVNREMIPIKERQIHPYRCFLTNNFLVHQKIFNAIKMNPELVGYGHEDTLFSTELKNRQIKIKHLDNPLRHIGLENTLTFLQQTKNGLKNLNYLIENGKIDIDNKLYAASKFFGIKFMRNYLLNWLKKNEKKLEKNFLSESPSLRKFDWYKLAQLIKIQHESKTNG